MLKDWESQRFETAVERLGLDDVVSCALRCAHRTIHVEMPLQRDDGSMVILPGYRVQHSQALGPGKGGVRYHPSVTLNGLSALARLMTWKTSIHQLPFGGAKGGVAIDPASFSPRELRDVTRSYILGILPVIGPEVDVLAPDVGTGPTTMGWALQAAADAGKADPKTVTGKPAVLGGSLFRAAATGVGVAHITSHALKTLGGSIQGSRVAIEGFGSVGLWTALELEERGATVVGVSDVSGAVHSDSIEVSGLAKWVNEGNPLATFPDADPWEGSVLTVPTDVAIPAALEGTVTGTVAEAMTARLVVEGANGPVTPDAESILAGRGVPIVPDVVANGGGVISSYFEWVQNHQRTSWTEHKERGRVLVRLDRTWARLADVPPESWRTVALDTAILRVVEALVASGNLVQPSESDFGTASNHDEV
jgi:glutamate dehydrogenase (NAD(P)+)